MMFTLTHADLVSSPATAPKIEKYYSLLRGEDLMQVHRTAMNLVLGRNLRRNVGYSAVMALELAQQGERVFYLNTYAGDELLRDAFAADGPGTKDITIANMPTGQWDPFRLTKLLEGHQVLIVNSFEFAAMTRAVRDRIAREILEIQQRHKLTVVIFSHEMKRDLEPGCGGRGPLGYLAAQAYSVSRVGEEWNIPTRGKAAAIMPQDIAREVTNAEKGTESARVHEKQTLNRNFMCKKFGGIRPNPTVQIDNDKGFSYHYGDYWSNPFDRGPYGDYTGRGMSLLARTPLLQQFFLANPDKKFMSSNTPTEAELAAQQSILA